MVAGIHIVGPGDARTPRRHGHHRRRDRGGASRVWLQRVVPISQATACRGATGERHRGDGIELHSALGVSPFLRCRVDRKRRAAALMHSWQIRNGASRLMAIVLTSSSSATSCVSVFVSKIRARLYPQLLVQRLQARPSWAHALTCARVRHGWHRGQPGRPISSRERHDEPHRRRRRRRRTSGID